MNFLTDEKIITSITNVLPFQIERKFEKLKQGEGDITVSIGLFGEIDRLFVLKGNENIFNELGKALYGMELDTSMLGSFACELWNMVLGGIVSNAGVQGIQVNITTPSLNPIFIADANEYHLDIINDKKIGSISVFVCEKESGVNNG